MCGFAAQFNLDGTPVHQPTLVRMRDVLSHRGPDDSGIFLDGHVGLAHRRLSIVDLSSAGHQPMSNEDGSIWLTFNGEVYNFVELMAELKRKGHVFRSATDSEVILHLYEEEGARCVERLNGMFAFVLWDRKRQRMFGARDRLGIKPFHFYHDSRLFAAASEIKALLEDSRIERRPNYEALADYFFAGYALAGKTPVAGVQELPPGCTLTVERGQVRVRQYWDLNFAPSSTRTPADTLDELSMLIDDAVRIHCRSDAPVGCHLSGGLDSSTIAALVARHHSPMKAFTVRFGEHEFYDESRHARTVAECTGMALYDVKPTSAELASLFGSLMWHMDTPIPDVVGFSYYSVARLAASHVKVALTGHGGDEVFAGYPAQFQAAYGTTSMFDLSGRPGSPAKVGLAGRLYRKWRSAGAAGLLRALAGRSENQSSLGDQWIAMHCGQRPATNPMLNRRFIRAVGDYSPASEYLQPLLNAPAADTLDKCLYPDQRVYLPHLLMKEDRASMAVSLESRVPLLDYRIVEFMATVPQHIKARDRIPKAMLRDVASKLLPAEVVHRNDKTPFPVPLREWASRDLAPMINEVVFSEQCLDRGIVAPNFLRRGSPTPSELLSIFNVEIWLRIFIDQDPYWLGQRPRAHGFAERLRQATPVAV